MKKFLISISAGAVIFGTLAVPVFASNAGDGSDYGTMPGYAVATSHTICADHGSFNAFGKNASLGVKKVHAAFLGSYPGPGTDGYQTGLNNSSLCGNRQNNLE